MARRRPLPPRTLEEVIEAFPAHRQSLLSTFDNCSLSALFGLENTPFTNAAQARGIIFHRTAAEILRTLRRTGEVKMPVSEALEILYEQAAQRDVPPEDVVTVPIRERRLLRIGVIKLVSHNEFRMKRLIAVERRLSTTVEYPHPEGGMVTRKLTGQPDALIADPKTEYDPVSGAIVLDWKMSLRAPPKGRDDDHWDTPESVSYNGYFQQRKYGLLVLKNYPSVQRVRLREFYPLENVARYGTVYRTDIEHLEREFAVLAELLDRALMGGSASKQWQPSPGKHCAYCPSPTRCPIKDDVRAREGGIATFPEMKRAVNEYVWMGETRKELHEALKNYIAEHGGENGEDYVTVSSPKGRYAVGWRKNKTGNGKQFTVFVPPQPDPTITPNEPEIDTGPDPRLDAALAEARERMP